MYHSEVSLHNYKLYRIDGAGRGGGVAIYVKSPLPVTVLNSVTVPHSSEFIARKVNFSRNNSINVMAVYRPLADLLSQCNNSRAAGSR